MITRALVVRLGLSQLICWGVSYYLIAVFGEQIGAELGWSQTVVHGGYSAALLVMGLASPLVGRAVDLHGGRPVMAWGSILTALGCVGLAASQGLALYYASWLCLGLAMRMTLYEAAFAALARVGGPAAKRPIAQITLLGGLASTVFWPIGHAVATAFGWRVALVAYAGFALATLPLHLRIPGDRWTRSAGGAQGEALPLAGTRGEARLAAWLYMVLATGAAFLNSGMSAHMIAILTGLGIGAGAAVGLATLRGIGQSSARLCEVLFGARLSPLVLTVIATSMLPICFVAGQLSGASTAMAAAFALLYGAGNGLVTIVRGTLPLVLFDPASYGRTAGRLLVPSFVLAALAPLAYAFVIEHLGEAAALHLSTGLSILLFGASILLWMRFRRG